MSLIKQNKAYDTARPHQALWRLIASKTTTPIIITAAIILPMSPQLIGAEVGTGIDVGSGVDAGNGGDGTTGLVTVKLPKRRSTLTV